MDAPILQLATAYHEAGHAVVAMSLGRPVLKVSILPKQDFLGVCHFAKGVFRPSRDWLEQEVLIALAGMASESAHLGHADRAGAARDLRYARRLAAQRAGERQAERLLDRMLARVKNLLADEAMWHAVESIASELLKLHTISGRAARHLFEQATAAD